MMVTREAETVKVVMMIQRERTLTRCEVCMYTVVSERASESK